eukprot:COSAG06_NODE_2107_length_7569_cov_4.625435_6_plen_247_part_00
MAARAVCARGGPPPGRGGSGGDRDAGRADNEPSSPSRPAAVAAVVVAESRAPSGGAGQAGGACKREISPSAIASAIPAARSTPIYSSTLGNDDDDNDGGGGGSGRAGSGESTARTAAACAAAGPPPRAATCGRDVPLAPPPARLPIEGPPGTPGIKLSLRVLSPPRGSAWRVFVFRSVGTPLVSCENLMAASNSEELAVMAAKDSMMCPGVGSAESGMAADNGRQAGRETEMNREVRPGTEAVAQQ